VYQKYLQVYELDTVAVGFKKAVPPASEEAVAPSPYKRIACVRTGIAIKCYVQQIVVI
jgi:hypothetical protein